MYYLRMHRFLFYSQYFLYNSFKFFLFITLSIPCLPTCTYTSSSILAILGFIFLLFSTFLQYFSCVSFLQFFHIIFPFWFCYFCGSIWFSLPHYAKHASNRHRNILNLRMRLIVLNFFPLYVIPAANWSHIISTVYLYGITGTSSVVS